LRGGIRTTAGSTKAVQPSPSSNRASTNETAAEPSRMMTSWSLNCSRMSSQMGVGGSSASAVVSLRQPLCASYTCCLVQHTIFTMLLAQSPDLLLREALVLCYLEIPERLCRRFGVCILHASSNAPPRGLLVAQSLLVLLYVCETNTEAVVERVVGMWMVWCGGKVRTRGKKIERQWRIEETAQRARSDGTCKCYTLRFT
jgi:hypothetical protein